MSIFSGDRTFHEKFSPLTTFFMVVFHVDAVAALFMFTWKALIVSIR